MRLLYAQKRRPEASWDIMSADTPGLGFQIVLAIGSSKGYVNCRNLGDRILGRNEPHSPCCCRRLLSKVWTELKPYSIGVSFPAEIQELKIPQEALSGRKILLQGLKLRTCVRISFTKI